MKEKAVLIFGKLKSSKVVIVLLTVLLAVILYRAKSLWVAASVNGQPISRLSVIHQLEREGGKTVLDTLIVNTLIMQEAKKEHVTVSSAEVSAQITQISNNLKAQGQDLTSALAAQGMTQNDLQDQVRLHIMLDKMAGKNLTVSDAEIQDSFNKNLSTYPKGTKLADVQDQIKSDLMQQKLVDAENSWVTGLKLKAKINYYVSY